MEVIGVQQGFGTAMPRRSRRPQHLFTVELTPWVIQPICLAPVLPGEPLPEY